MRLKRTPTWMTSCIAILLVVVAAGSQSRAPSPILAAPSTTSPTPQPSIYPRMPRISSTAGLLNVAAKPTNTPDLDVEYIGRTPRYKWCYVGVMNCSGVKQWPSAGETVTFEGRIANRGDVASGSFSYAWYIDGVLTSQASQATMAAGGEDVVRFNWTWATGAHTVKLVLDSTSVIPEVSEKNNSVEDRTNALTLGIYVEQAVYNYFNTNIWQADWDGNTSTLDGNSFDDWLQRQVSVWNKMFADAKYGLTPNGVIDRVRLDKVVRVANGALQCQTNNPAGIIVTPVPPFQYGIDFEVDLIWGFPSGALGFLPHAIPIQGDSIAIQPTVIRGTLNRAFYTNSVTHGI